MDYLFLLATNYLAPVEGGEGGQGGQGRQGGQGGQCGQGESSKYFAPLG